MKKHGVFLTFLIICIVSCRDGSIRSNSDPALETKLHMLRNQHEYFDLRKQLPHVRPNISPIIFHFFNAFVQNAFNQNESSIETINDLTKTDHQLSDSLMAELLLIQCDNYVKVFDYKKAAETTAHVINRYQNGLANNDIEEIKNQNKIYEGLKKTPPQKTMLTKNSMVEWKKDKVGLMRIPVKINGTVNDFIFDTRAGISVIMKSYAEKLKLRMLGVRYREGSGTTGKTFEAELGVADSLLVGNIRVFNVVFQVLPDEVLSFPTFDYSMNGIIGFPVIAAWKRFRIDQNGKIHMVNNPILPSLKNLAFEGSAMVVCAGTDTDTLTFYIDSGANTTQLFSNFFVKHKSMVKEIAGIDTIEVGGVGGLAKKEIYTLPTFTLHIGDKSAALENIEVLTQPTYPGQKYYGNLGQDVFSAFDAITFDFDEMSFSFE